jgi:hypothetical protein
MIFAYSRGWAKQPAPAELRISLHLAGSVVTIGRPLERGVSVERGGDMRDEISQCSKTVKSRPRESENIHTEQVFTRCDFPGW